MSISFAFHYKSTADCQVWVEVKSRDRNLSDPVRPRPNKEEIQNLIDNGVPEKEAKVKAPILIEAKKMLISWENEDSEVRALWREMNGWVYEGFEKTYLIW